MAQDDGILIAVIGGAIVMIGYYLFTTKGGILDQAKQAGAEFARQVNLTTTTARGAQEGYPAPYVPPTPEGYNLSNWTWTLPDNTMLGLPAGLTPGEFCMDNQSAPVCSQIKRTW